MTWRWGIGFHIRGYYVLFNRQRQLFSERHNYGCRSWRLPLGWKLTVRFRRKDAA